MQVMVWQPGINTLSPPLIPHYLSSDCPPGYLPRMSPLWQGRWWELLDMSSETSTTTDGQSTAVTQMPLPSSTASHDL